MILTICFELRTIVTLGAGIGVFQFRNRDFCKNSAHAVSTQFPRNLQAQ